MISNINTKVKAENNGEHYRLAQGGPNMALCKREPSGAYTAIAELGRQVEIDQFTVEEKRAYLHNELKRVLDSN